MDAVGDPPKVIAFPRQVLKVKPETILIMGNGFTLTVTILVEISFPSETVKVYCVLTVGDAIGLETVVLLNPVAGDQK